MAIPEESPESGRYVVQTGTSYRMIEVFRVEYGGRVMWRYVDSSKCHTWGMDDLAWSNNETLLKVDP